MAAGGQYRLHSKQAAVDTGDYFRKNAYLGPYLRKGHSASLSTQLIAYSAIVDAHSCCVAFGVRN